MKINQLRHLCAFFLRIGWPIVPSALSMLCLDFGLLSW
jgi:hypothetical protein